MTAVTDAIHKILDGIEFRLQLGDISACQYLSNIISKIMLKVQPYLPKNRTKPFRSTIYYQYDALFLRAKAIYDQYCASP